MASEFTPCRHIYKGGRLLSEGFLESEQGEICSKALFQAIMYGYLSFLSKNDLFPPLCKFLMGRSCKGNVMALNSMISPIWISQLNSSSVYLTTSFVLPPGYLINRCLKFSMPKLRASVSCSFLHPIKSTLSAVFSVSVMATERYHPQPPCPVFSLSAVNIQSLLAPLPQPWSGSLWVISHPDYWWCSYLISLLLSLNPLESNFNTEAGEIFLTHVLSCNSWAVNA